MCDRKEEMKLSGSSENYPLSCIAKEASIFAIFVREYPKACVDKCTIPDIKQCSWQLAISLCNSDICAYLLFTVCVPVL